MDKAFALWLTSSLPGIKMFADVIQRAIAVFGKLPKPIGEAVVGLGAFKLLAVAL